MKVSTTTTAIILAATLGCVSAAPSGTSANSLSIRETNDFNALIGTIDQFAVKRSELSTVDLKAREVQIVTDALSLLNDSQLAPKVVDYIINDPELSQSAADLIVNLIKADIISSKTLLVSLNDSGLAVSVIRDLINDCNFYGQIYRIVGQVVGNLANRIWSLIFGNNRREYNSDLVSLEPMLSIEKRYTEEDATAVVTSIMESLKNSGLANSVIQSLVSNDNFYTFGADLIVRLIKEGVLDYGSILSSLIQSNLIPTLFREFANIPTLLSVIENAFASAFGKCDGSTVIPSPSGSITPSRTGVAPGPTGSGTVTVSPGPGPTANPNCKKRRRSYNY